MASLYLLSLYLDVPVPVPHVVQPELVGDLGGVHGVGEVLLVGEDEEHGVTELVLGQHSVKLVPGLSYPLPIVAVHHEDESFCVLEVMSPERPDFILTTDIPDCKADVLVFNSLNIEPFSISQSYNEHNICINRGRGDDNLSIGLHHCSL